MPLPSFHPPLRQVGAAASYKWQHWACVTERTNGKIGTPDQLQGLSWLRAHDQAAVRQRFPGAGGKAPRKTGVRTLFD